MVDIAVFELEIDLLLVALVWLCNRDKKKSATALAEIC
jgi:hypothetical protein